MKKAASMHNCFDAAFFTPGGIHMFLCIDPGSKYIGYTIINNFKIVANGVLEVLKTNIIKDLEKILDENKTIHTVLIEKAEKSFIRYYEEALVNLFIDRNLKLITYQAKPIRKKLKLERHPSSLGIKAKEDLFRKKFSNSSLQNISIHELDSALLYIYHQQ